MLTLSAKQVQLNAHAQDKNQAIALVAQGLARNGNVSLSYATCMWQREQQASTYLGNGIAMPHGDVKGQAQVQHTGVYICQFPNGVPWSENQDEIAYIVIGIAAKSDAHLPLLRQLTSVLNDEAKMAQLVRCNEVDQFLALFHPRQILPLLDARLIQMNLATSNLVALSAANAAALQTLGYVSTAFWQKVQFSPPLALAPQVYLLDSPVGNLANGIAIARNQQGISLLSIAIVDSTLHHFLNQLRQTNILAEIQHADTAQLLHLFQANLSPSSPALEIVCTLPMPEGLHVRPSTRFVNLAKQFTAQIQVQNLQNDTPPLDGKRLLNLLALAAKKGDCLRIIAQGEDASAALHALKHAIENGLSEPDRHDLS